MDMVHDTENEERGFLWIFITDHPARAGIGVYDLVFSHPVGSVDPRESMSRRRI